MIATLIDQGYGISVYIPLKEARELGLDTARSRGFDCVEIEIGALKTKEEQKAARREQK